jgi:hypothetical protein
MFALEGKGLSDTGHEPSDLCRDRGRDHVDWSERVALPQQPNHRVASDEIADRWKSKHDNRTLSAGDCHCCPFKVLHR